MESTNHYVPNYSESFKMEELQPLNNLRVWRIKSKKLQKNDDNIPNGIWDWAKRNKNYKDLLEELKVDKLTNEEIFSEFFFRNLIIFRNFIQKVKFQQAFSILKKKWWNCWRQQACIKMSNNICKWDLRGGRWILFQHIFQNQCPSWLKP